jgi:hypothetical protein
MCCVTAEQNGKLPKKPPERGDALKIDLPFEKAVRAALETPPENGRKKAQRKTRSRNRAP